MSTEPSSRNASNDHVIFHVGDAALAIDISSVQAINLSLDVTPVHLAPDEVCGIINLRGQIVTTIDLRKKLGLPPLSDEERARIGNGMRNVVVRSSNELVGLVVEAVDDIVCAGPRDVHKSPPHLKGAAGKYFSGVYEHKDELVGILDVEAFLALE